MAGAVRVSGKIVDAHAACGNGVDWMIEHRSPRESAMLASGAIANGGTQGVETGEHADRLNAVTVEPGDFVQLVVLPKGEYSCDLTTVELEIVEQDGQKRVGIWRPTSSATCSTTDAATRIATARATATCGTFSISTRPTDPNGPSVAPARRWPPGSRR